MKKTLCKAKVWLIPVLAVLALCMCALAALLPTRANAEAPVYEVTGINGVVAATGTTNDAFYVNASSVSESVTGTWHIQYGGAAKKNGADITVTFRIIKEENRTLYFEGLNASEGDVISVGGIYPITNVIDGCPVTVAVGDYSVNLEEAEFVYNGDNTWEKVKIKVDEAPAENVFLDANGTDLWLSGQVVGINDNTAANNWWGFLPGSDVNLKVSYTSNALPDGETIQINLAKRYKASNFTILNVKMLIGNAAGVVHTAYATADTEFTTPAGATSTTNETEVAVLNVEASKIADSEGYFDSFVIKRTGGSAGQVFVDYVELVPDKKDDTEYKQNVVLPIDGNSVAMDNGTYGEDTFGVMSDDKTAIVASTANIGNNTAIKFTFKTKYKAANFSTVSITIGATNWTANNVITTTMYALTDTGFAVPLASATNSAEGFGRATITANAEALADNYGYIGGFYLVKTQTDPADTPWQFFAGAVTLNVPSYTMTIKDGDGTVTKNVVKGESFAVADIGAVNSATHIVAGYKINGKLYSKDYTFVPAENTEIEVVRVAFRVLDGAYIKYIGGTGLRFMLSLNEADYEAVKTLVSEENVSFGVIMIKIDSEGKDFKSMVKEAENYYVEDGTIKFNGVVTGFPETAEAYKTQFRAGGYLGIKYEDKTDVTMIYADEPAAEYKIRSIYEVAKAAIEAGVTGEALVACENIVNTVENANSVLSATNLPDYNAKKKI
mgnify:CR=1 FL=1